jgi:hypothetical protein
MSNKEVLLATHAHRLRQAPTNRKLASGARFVVVSLASRFGARYRCSASSWTSSRQPFGWSLKLMAVIMLGASARTRAGTASLHAAAIASFVFKQRWSCVTCPRPLIQL